MKGFTLLEVLIAITVLSLSMLGVYRISSMSVETSEYAVSKALVTEAGYQRILETMNYPDKVFTDSELNYDDIRINFTEESQPTLFTGVDEISLTAEYEGVASTYVYYSSE